MPHPIQAIAFDAVGTTLYPAEPVAQTYAAAAARQGVEIPLEVVAQRFAEAFQAEDDALLANQRSSQTIERERWQQIVARTLPEVPDLKRAFRELWDHYQRGEAWSLFDDVLPTLRRLRSRGIRLAMASNFDLRLFFVVMRHSELAEQLEFVLPCSVAGWRKPNRRFFEFLARELDLPAAGILHVGDSWEHDVAAPAEIGMPAIWLRRDGGATSEHPSIASLGELANRLDRADPSW